jgi:hypothetical protein
MKYSTNISINLSVNNPEISYRNLKRDGVITEKRREKHIKSWEMKRIEANRLMIKHFIATSIG